MQPAIQIREQPIIDPLPPAGEGDQVSAVLDAVSEQLGFIPDGLCTFKVDRQGAFA